MCCCVPGILKTNTQQSNGSLEMEGIPVKIMNWKNILYGKYFYTINNLYIHIILYLY